MIKLCCWLIFCRWISEIHFSSARAPWLRRLDRVLSHLTCLVRLKETLVCLTFLNLYNMGWYLKAFNRSLLDKTTRPRPPEKQGLSPLPSEHWCDLFVMLKQKILEYKCDFHMNWNAKLLLNQSDCDLMKWAILLKFSSSYLNWHNSLSHPFWNNNKKECFKESPAILLLNWLLRQSNTHMTFSPWKVPIMLSKL